MSDQLSEHEAAVAAAAEGLEVVHARHRDGAHLAAVGAEVTVCGRPAVREWWPHETERRCPACQDWAAELLHPPF